MACNDVTWYVLQIDSLSGQGFLYLYSRIHDSVVTGASWEDAQRFRSAAEANEEAMRIKQLSGGAMHSWIIREGN